MNPAQSYCFNPQCAAENADGTKFCQKCGGKLLLRDRYRALRKIGQGGFGETWLARDENKPSKPYCVIKHFTPQSSSGRQKAMELFKQEAVRLDQLGKHPQIPELLEHFEDKEQLYIIQEFIDGENLEKVVEREGAYTEQKIWHLLSTLLPVLKFLHENKIIHRDIKPQNIIRRQKDDQLILVDFGAAKLMTEEDLNRTGTKIGDPGYMAPEQTRGKADFTSDLYSLGLTCVYLLTEVNPIYLFDASEGDWAWKDVLGDVNNKISLELESILSQLLQMASKKRPQSADAVLQMLPQYVFASAPPSTEQPELPVNKAVEKIGVEERTNPFSTAAPPTPVQLGNKWGYQDQAGNNITVTLFEAARKFSEGLAAVKLNGRWGFISQTGVTAVEFYYCEPEYFIRKSDSTFYSQEAYTVIPIPIDILPIIPPSQFSHSYKTLDSQEAYTFVDGRAIVRGENGKYAYINKSGEVIFPFELDSLPGNFSDGLAAIQVNNKFGYINYSLQVVIQPHFDAADIFSNGLAPVSYLLKSERTYENKLKWGYIDKSGKVVIPTQYDEVKNFSDGIAKVRIDNKWGLIDVRGRLVSQLFDEIGDFSQHRIAKVKIGNEWGLIDTKGRLISQLFEQVSLSDSNQLALVTRSSSLGKRKYGCINFQGKLIGSINGESFFDRLHLIQLEEERYNTHDAYIILVQIGRKVGLLNKSGQLLGNQLFDEIRTGVPPLPVIRHPGINDLLPDHYVEYKEIVCVAKDDNKYALINLVTGQILSGFCISIHLHRLINDVIFVEIDKRLFLLTNQGQLVKRYGEYKLARAFESNHQLFVVSKQDRYCLVNCNLQEVTSTYYDEIKPWKIVIPPKTNSYNAFSEIKYLDKSSQTVSKQTVSRGLAKVRCGKMVGYIDDYGRQVIPMWFNSTYEFSDKFVGDEISAEVDASFLGIKTVYSYKIFIYTNARSIRIDKVALSGSVFRLCYDGLKTYPLLLIFFPIPVVLLLISLILWSLGHFKKPVVKDIAAKIKAFNKSQEPKSFNSSAATKPEL
jgi:serine/threonine protein kinase